MATAYQTEQVLEESGLETIAKLQVLVEQIETQVKIQLVASFQAVDIIGGRLDNHICCTVDH